MTSTARPPPRHSFCTQLYARASRVKSYSAIEANAGSTQGSAVGISAPHASANHLERRLGKLDVTLVGVGASIGAGIFVVSGEAARIAGPSVIISFFIAAFVCVLNALCYAEMASRIPVSGSAYVYASAVLGEGVAILTGINLLFDYHIGAALISRNLVHYIFSFLKACGIIGIPDWLESISITSAPFLSLSFIAPAILLLLACILCQGISESAKVNNILTSLKCLVVVFVIFTGITKLDTDNLQPFAPKGVSAVFSASSLCFFAFIGFDAVCNTAEEAVKPSKTLPFGIIASLLICAALYALVTLVLTGLVPYSKLPADASLSEAFSNIPGMNWVKIFIDVGAIIGLTTTLFLGIYSQSRMYLAIARDRLLPRKFAFIDSHTGAPRNATLLCATIACVLAGFCDVERLSRVLDMGILLSYSVVSSAVLLLRADEATSQYALPGQITSEEATEPLIGQTRLTVNSRRWRCIIACLALSVSPLLPGFSIANEWGIHPTILIVYSIAALAMCAFLIWRADLGLGRNQSIQSSEDASFSTPYPRVIASLALASNSYLLSQRPIEGWVRLLLISLLVVVAYIIAVFRSSARTK